MSWHHGLTRAVDQAVARDLGAIAVSSDALTVLVDTAITEGFVTTPADQVEIGTYGVGYDFDIDWGDGSEDHYTDAELAAASGLRHTYAAPGQYEIKVRGAFPRYRASPDASKWIEVRDWGRLVLDSTDNMMSRTTNVQIVGKALHSPPKTPHVARWKQAFVLCGSDYHPSYDTSAATMLDRMFYLAKLKRAPMLSTGNCRNFHNFFRSCSELEGPIPNYNIGKAEYLYRFFRNCPKLTSEDIPLWETAHVKSMNTMFADCPLITSIPPTFTFESIGLPITPEFESASTAPSLQGFIAGYIHEIGAAQVGQNCGVSDINGFDFSGAEDLAFFAYRNESLVHVNQDFQACVNLTRGFERNTSLVSLVLNVPNLTSGASLVDGCLALTTLHLTLSGLAALGTVVAAGNTALSSVLLTGYSKSIDISGKSLTRSALAALFTSLGTAEAGAFIACGGNPGFAELTQQDLDVATLKGWTVLAETSYSAVDTQATSANSGPVALYESTHGLHAIGGDLALNTRGYASLSADDGATWTLFPGMPSGDTFRSMIRFGDTILLQRFGSTSSLRRSTNNGATWANVTPVSAAVGFAQSLIGNSENQALNYFNFAAGAVRFRHSAGGGSWADFTSYPGGTRPDFMEYLPSLGWIFAKSDGSGFVLRDTLFAAAETEIAAPSTINGEDPIDPALWGFAMNHEPLNDTVFLGPQIFNGDATPLYLFQSSDAGQTWQNSTVIPTKIGVKPNRIITLIRSRGDFVGIIVRQYTDGTDMEHQVYVSSDGGVTFTLQSTSGLVTFNDLYFAADYWYLVASEGAQTPGVLYRRGYSEIA